MLVNKFCTYLLLLPVAIILTACSGKTELAPDAYIAYVENPENGCVISRKFDQVGFTMSFTPEEYKTLKDLRMMDSALTQSAFNTYRTQVKGACYFTMKIESLNSGHNPLKMIASTPEDQAKVYRYIQGPMQGDFHLECNDRVIPCILYHMEDDYNILNYALVSLAFDSRDVIPGQDLTLVFNDQLFRNGPIKFTITKEHIKQIPTLKLS